MTTAAIIVAAGKGIRAGGELPKQFQSVAGKALVAHAVDGFRSHPGIDKIIIIHASGHEDLLEQALDTRQVDAKCVGGILRQDSVLIGLETAQSLGCDIVLIHDAARPFIPASALDRLLAALTDHDGAVPTLAVVDTVARGTDILEETVDRTGLFRVQTPQAFRLDAILTSHRHWPKEEATDDAQIARKAGFSVALVNGDSALDKVTHAEDFARMETKMQQSLISRTGFGYDVHQLGVGEELWLCGIQIPHDRGLIGHSDADVALHALVDAILGALADGDIGTHFPPSDAQWKNAPSARFLEHARDLVVQRGGVIDHVDVTLICEAPRIGPYRDAMRWQLAALLQISPGNVSLKATTTEKLGFTGREEGMAAQAVATIRLPQEP